MNPKTVNPYLDIELSPDSEPDEPLRAPDAADREQRGRKGGKKAHAKVARGKKSDAVIKSVRTIRNKLAIGDVISLAAEFDALLAEIARMKKSIEVEGQPLAFLQVLDLLNDAFVLGKTPLDPKKKKELSKQLNILKKKITAAFSENSDEIAEAKKSPEFFREETLEEVEGAGPAEPSDQASEAPSQPSGDEEPSEDEADEMDFSRRLALVGEERRRFWLLKPKEKKEAAAKRPGKRPPRQQKVVERAAARRFVEDEDEFKGIDLTPAGLQKRMKDLYDRKMMFKGEELTAQFRLLNYIYENVGGSKAKAETLLLLLNFQLELARGLGLPRPEFWEECSENCRALFELVKDPHLRLTNYIKGADVELERPDLLRYFNGFLNQFNNEVIYSLKLSDPFEEDFARRVDHEIDWVGFLLQVNAFFEGQPASEARTRYLNDTAFKIVEHVYHNTDDFVLNSEKLSRLFESEKISAMVGRLAEFVYATNAEERAMVRMRLFHAFNLALNLEALDRAGELLHGALESGLLARDRYLVGLFNRALAVLGAGEFKLGNLAKCKYYLFELVNSENIEALLYQYDPSATNVLDFSDPLCMFPYHMHINLDEVEAAFLLASVLTEAHHAVNFQDSLGRSAVNKKLLRFIEGYQQDLFINSMTNIFDQVFVCYRKIVQYDYKAAFAAVRQVKYLSNQENYEAQILQRVKVECLNCYMEKLKLESQAVVSVADLAAVFDIPAPEFLALLRNKIEESDFGCRLDEEEGLLRVDNRLSGVLQNDGDFELLESLKSFRDLNAVLGRTGKERSGARVTAELNEASQLIHRKFDSQDKYFNFVYDYSYFKKVLG